ncbi:aldose 1-epimerase [Gordoniibacillus kamchatkensis]|uniref:aldose 1-epimerase n=1 Tax=Gordoniibacillus kamchatkensis TaxID=1590651 RepID=UPI0022B15C69|nr:aldose 1-epimerase [Paenibacillus sp. VKM B-2647]
MASSCSASRRASKAYRQMPLLYGIPVLFPPNRIENGRFVYNGREYQFERNEKNTGHHAHGMVYQRRWELLKGSAEAGEAVIVTKFDSAQHPDVIAQFPHRFRVRMTFTLRGSKLIQEAEVTNLSEEAFPWGLGYHTTFSFPFRGKEDRLDKCTLAVNAAKRWVLNSQFLPTGELQDFDGRERLNAGLPMEGVVLDDVFLSSAGCGETPNEALLTDGNIGLKVAYRCDGNMTQWVLHNGGGGQGFFCPEPYTWVTNAPNLPLDRSLTGLQELEPGMSRTVRCLIAIEPAETSV